MDHLYLGMVNAIVSIGGLGFIVWSQGGSKNISASEQCYSFERDFYCMTAGNLIRFEVNLSQRQESDRVEKSSNLSNQQETSLSAIGEKKDNEVVSVKGGSSETIRRMSYCSWLLGFFEAEGTITKDKRIIITQKDERILYRIRSWIGAGSVTGPRVVISKKDYVRELGEIIRDKGKLDKTRDKLTNLKGLIGESRVGEKEEESKFVSLGDGWLSGFIEGDGGFNIEIRKDKRYNQGYRVRTRLYVVQKGDKRIMDNIARLIGGQLEDKGEEVYRVVLTSIRGSIRMRDYFKKYPLRTIKRIDMLRWMKVVDMMERKEHLTARIEKIREIKNRMNKR